MSIKVENATGETAEYAAEGFLIEEGNRLLIVRNDTTRNNGYCTIAAYNSDRWSRVWETGAEA